MYKNKKGQALVEFVIILPIFLIIIFAFFDLSRILIVKNSLSTKLNNAIILYNSGKDKNEIQTLVAKDDLDVNINIIKKEDIATISITKKINPITPGFNYLPSNVFEIKEQQSTNIYSENKS